MTKLITTLILYTLLASAFTAFTIGAIAVASAERIDPTASIELFDGGGPSLHPTQGSEHTQAGWISS